MKKGILHLILLALCTSVGFSQQLTQTVRGVVIDVDSELPLIGASVIVIGSDPLIGTVTDIDGRFRLDHISIGRYTLQLTYLGYESQTLPNIVVNSGKEVVLNLKMQESVVRLEEVVISGNSRKGTALNDMSLLSTRSISVEQTERYAGGFNDPSRIVSAFAGVANTQDGSNDIIIRGNSPKYMQWRLEGTEITNPNHFADQNAVGGGISTLNNNLLATSDFYTGAFSPEFGNALSGVYDIKLRPGNNEKYESSFGFGLLGTDLTLEGPFKKGYGGSFLINYRYSTISLIDKLGLVDIGGIPKFQDAAFKVQLPTKNMGTFSLFGLMGISSLHLDDVKPDIQITPGENPISGDIAEDFEKDSYLLNTGVNHTIALNDNSFIKTTLSFSTDGIDEEVFQSKRLKIYDGDGMYLRDSLVNKRLNYQSNLKKTVYRGAITYSNKINAKHKIQIGSKYALFDYDNKQKLVSNETGNWYDVINFKEQISTIRNFVSWKYRINENLTLVTGLHNMNVLLNNKNTFESRTALNWKINESNSISVGFGEHSNMESIHNYFSKVKQPDGSFVEPNKDLDLLKARHYVLGYEKRFTKNLMAKVELYYQDLYDIPVENNDTSYYSTINEGLDFRYVDLVNEGTAENYGIEVTLERFLNDNYYFLINGSLFNSTYKTLDGKERNTQYNGSYILNILCGKEFVNLGKKKNKTLSINAKLFFGGGKKHIPLLRDGEGNLAVNPAEDKYWDYSKAYEDKIEDVYQITLSAGYKINKKKATHEFFINLDNITNTKGKLSEYYDEDEPGGVGNLTQFGFFPNLMYKIHF